MHENLLTATAAHKAIMQAVLASSGDCIKVLDREGKLVLINGPGLSVMEIDSCESVYGQPWCELWPEVSRAQVRDAMLSAADGHIARFEGFCPTAKGTPKWWEVVVTPIHGESGILVGMVAISRDVTRQRANDLQVIESESRFQSLADNMSQLAWMANPEGHIFWYNQRWFDYTGTTLAEMRGWGWRSVHHPNHIERVVTKIRRAFETGENWEDTFPLRGVDGKYRWFLSRMTSIRDDQGNVIRWMGTNTDVTESLRVQEELRRSEQKLSLGAAVGLLGLAELDYHTNRMELTPTAAQIYGFPSGTTSISRSEFHNVFHPEDRPWLEEAMARALMADSDKEDEILALEHRIIRADGQLRWVSIRKQYFYERPEQGINRATHSIIAVRDITQQKELEIHLRHAQELSEVASRAKSVFLANMSHEIRSPMTAILGYAALLNANHDDERVKIEAIRRNGRFLMSLLNDILDLSKIEADKMDVQRVPFSPGELVRDVGSMMRMQAEERGLDLDVQFLSPIPIEISSDPIRLRQILVNLVGNAIKFTETGGVKLLVSHELEWGRLRFDVVDTGCGIATEHIAVLFRPFEQADSSVGRKYGGTGLGLAISHRLARMLDGRIDVQSQPGVGSTFSLILDHVECRRSDRIEYQIDLSPDVDARESPTCIAARSAGMGPLRVLVVDDRRDIRFVASQLLARAGGEVITAGDGAEALSVFEEERRCGRRIDAILMDVQMPEMDGLTATRAFRDRGEDLPIIALTANATESDREATYAAGYTDYLSKPIQFDRLVEVLQRHCG